jgi:hypothetical protein
MSQTLQLPDELFDRLRRVAAQEGLDITQLLAQWVEALTPINEDSSDETEENEDALISACTKALLNGSEPPIAVNWDELMEAVQNSEPLYPTVEEAMSALRGRPWKKDE